MPEKTLQQQNLFCSLKNAKKKLHVELTCYSSLLSANFPNPKAFPLYPKANQI